MGYTYPGPMLAPGGGLLACLPTVHEGPGGRFRWVYPPIVSYHTERSCQAPLLPICPKYFLLDIALILWYTPEGGSGAPPSPHSSYHCYHPGPKHGIYGRVDVGNSLKENDYVEQDYESSSGCFAYRYNHSSGYWAHVGSTTRCGIMSIPIFRTDNKSLRTLGISPKAYGWLSVAVAWITRGGWWAGMAWSGTKCVEWNPTSAADYMNKVDDVKSLIVDKRWKMK